MDFVDKFLKSPANRNALNEYLENAGKKLSELVDQEMEADGDKDFIIQDEEERIVHLAGRHITTGVTVIEDEIDEYWPQGDDFYDMEDSLWKYK